MNDVIHRNDAIRRHTVAFVQCRTGSKRFPAKVLAPLGGSTVLGFLLSRLQQAHSLDDIVVTTTDTANDDQIQVVAESFNVKTFRGAEHDVLGRFLAAAETTHATHCVRITADCPLTDPALVDAVVNMLHSNAADYVSNTLPPTYPDGFDVEAFTIMALREADRVTTRMTDREHVTPKLRTDSRFSRLNLAAAADTSDLRLTIDERVDLDVVSAVVDHFHEDPGFSVQAVIDFMQSQPHLLAKNSMHKRNEGTVRNSGQKLWERAKRVIPGGNMLLSKRPEMMLPGEWPTYFTKTQGCHVWDLDGRQLTDCSLMGVGTNSLGYNRPEVDDAVRSIIDLGTLSTLNCPEEVELAERLVALHPWSDMARFARSGGEANAIAVRIARAASGKQKIAVCGYHGWHDWYLALNLPDATALDAHLLSGLDPKGVPASLSGTVEGFNYGDLHELQRIVSAGDVGVIKMEVVRNGTPPDGFLGEVRRIADANGIILIFDECTSGFRASFGGIHLAYDVAPDMAVFGKTLGNGYAISAVLGRRQVMECAQSTFISSTFWTERIGPTAALATLDVMDKERSWEVISTIGAQIKGRWSALANANGFEVSLTGVDALAGFTFTAGNHLEMKTYISQEMLKQGFLASTNFFVSTAHTPEVVDDYFECLEPVFATLGECHAGRRVADLLEGPVCHDGFKRLT